MLSKTAADIRTIEAQFQDFANHVFPEKDEKTISAIKKVYFAGYFSAIQTNTELAGVPDEIECCKVLDRQMAECMQFFLGIRGFHD